MTKIQRVTKPKAQTISKTTGKELPKEVQQLQKQKNAEVIKNADGSVTRRRETSKTSKEVTTREGKLLENTTEFTKRSTRGSSQSESTFTAKTDMIGRKSAESRRETVNAKGDVSVFTKGADVFGVQKQGTEKTTERLKGETRESAVRTTSKDSVGNSFKSSDVTRVTDSNEGKTVVTTNDKRAKGSDLTTRSSTTYEDGKFSISDGADWSKTNSFDKSYLKETEVDPAKTEKFLEKTDKVTGWVGKIFKALGLEGQWEKSLSEDLMKTSSIYESDRAQVTTQVGVAGSQRFEIDGDGMRASYDREAKAGVYAHAHDAVTGKYGQAEYTADAAAEAYARFNAKGQIDANGLDATVNAKVGVAVQAEITGRAQSNAAHWMGTDLYVAAEGHAKVAAEASAEVTGQVKITRNPPTAIAQGTAGASAVAKAEADVKLSAGPFSVVANVYGSAGAEARATGIIGYQDGKFKIGGSVGAALGLGAGGGATVEVDVRQIGQMAKNAADVNNDGKLDIHDATAAVSKGAKKVASWFGFGH